MTNQRRNNNRRRNSQQRNNRHEEVIQVINRMANRYDAMGQARMQRAVRRAVEGGRTVRINPAEIFELVRIYAYAAELHTAECNRREREGIPQTRTERRPYYIVDHIVPHSRGGSLTPANLGIALEGSEFAKGNDSSVELDYIEVPEDFAVFDKVTQQSITTYTRD